MYIRILKSKIFSFSKKPFVRNVAAIVTGTTIAQVSGILFTPIITRLYGPEAFGLLGTFVALISIFTPIAAFCYPIAIILPEKDEDALRLIKISFYISIAVSGIVTVILLLGKNYILNIFDANSISDFIILIPLNILFAAWLQIIQNWLIRKKKFKIEAKAIVAQTVIVNSAKVSIGFFYPYAAILLIFTTLSNIIHSGILYFGLKKSKSLPDNYSTKPESSLLTIAKRYRDFAFYRTPQVFINSISQGLPILMLAAFFGPIPVGFYALGNKLLGIPSNLIGKSFGDVFYPRISEAARNGEDISKLILKATIYLFLLGIGPFTIIIFYGTQIFNLVFGNEWTKAGEYSQWLSIWILFMFINIPSVKAIPVLLAQKFHLIFSFFTITVRLSMLIIGYYFFESDIIAIALFSVAGGFNNIILILIVLYKSKIFYKIQKENENVIIS